MVFAALTVGVVAAVLVGSLIFGIEPQRRIDKTPETNPSYYETRSEINQSP